MNKEKLLEILSEFFGLNSSWEQGTYFYNLIRVKTAELTVEDFEEIEYEQIEELADIIMENMIK